MNEDNPTQHIFYFLRGVVKLIWAIITGSAHIGKIFYHTIFWRVISLPTVMMLIVGKVTLRFFKKLVKMIITGTLAPFKFIYKCGLPKSGTFKVWFEKNKKTHKKDIEEVLKRNEDGKDNWSIYYAPLVAIWIILTMISTVVMIYILPADFIEEASYGIVVFGMMAGIVLTMYVDIHYKSKWNDGSIGDLLK